MADTSHPEGDTTRTINGIRISYSDVGSGVPLLCLHGGMGVDGNALRVPGILDLSRQGIRVIIPDQRGHGLSGRSDSNDYSHAVWTSDAHALAGSLGISRFGLLGHSYGGFLALEYAIRWPESLSHLILVATSAGPVRVPTESMASDADLRESFRKSWPRFFAGADKYWSFFETLRFTADAYNAAFTRELPRYDVREHLSALRMPCLLIVGDQDSYRPHMEWLAEQILGAVLCVIKDAGHFPFLEAAPQFTGTVAGFLKGPLARTPIG